MISNALECDAPIIPSASNLSSGVQLMGNEAIEGRAFDETINLRDGDGVSKNIKDHKFDGQLQGLGSFNLTSKNVSLTHVKSYSLL